MENIRIDTASRDFEIPMLNDQHYGSANRHENLIKDALDDIEGKEKYILDGGDTTESIAPNDKRFTMLGTDPKQSTAMAQADGYIEDHRRVRDQIAVKGMGNHEWKLINIVNIGEYIAKALKVPFGGYTYVASFFHNDKPLFKVFNTHGWGRMPKGAKDPIQRDANRRAWLKRKLEGTGFSDCIVMNMGHTHHLLIQKPTIDEEHLLTTTAKDIHQFTRPMTRQNANYIPPEMRWFCNSGSFNKTYSKPGSGIIGYGEIMQLEPTDLGWAEIVVRDGEVVGVQKCYGTKKEKKLL